MKEIKLELKEEEVEKLLACIRLGIMLFTWVADAEAKAMRGRWGGATRRWVVLNQYIAKEIKKTTGIEKESFDCATTANLNVLYHVIDKELMQDEDNRA